MRRPGLLWDSLACAALVVVLFASSAGYLGDTLASAIPGGWDGVGHYAIADLYAKHLFPALSGWLPQYFAGMPFPTLYPPLFYLLVAAGTKLGASTAASFWAVEITATAAVPVLTYACARQLIESRAASVFAGLLSVAYLVQDGEFAKNGIALRATFEVGLASHTLGFCVVLLFYALLLSAARRPSSAPLAALCLGLVPLANVHVVPAAVFLFAALVAIHVLRAPDRDARRRLVLLYGWIGIAGLLVSSCWVLPMVAALPYVVTQSLDAPPMREVMAALWAPGVCLLAALVIAWKRRDEPVLALCVALPLLALFALGSPRVLPFASIQPARLVVAAYFLGVLPVAYCVASARSAALRLTVGAVCAVLLLLWIRPVRITDASVRPTQKKEYESVLSALSGKTDGRVLVEAGGDPLSDRFALQALVGQGGSFSLTTVFREASISALFTVPLRNAFSSNGESFLGIDSKIPSPIDMLEPPDRTLARLAVFDVRYVAVTSALAKARVSALPGTRRLTSPGAWELYALPERQGDGFATVPPFAPVLTFASFSVKQRPDFSFDFIRLGEELFSEGRSDILLARSHTGRIDREDYGPFRVALVTDYRYDDQAVAFSRIEEFSREHPVILLADEDPLFQRLAALSRTRPTLHVVARSAPSERGATALAIDVSGAGGVGDPRLLADRMATHRTCLAIFALLGRLQVPLRDAATVVAAAVEGDRTSIRLRDKPSSSTPVLVRQTYWPTTASSHDEPIYMASPTLALLFTTEPAVELRVRPGGASRAGALASCVGLAVIAVGVLARRAARRMARRRGRLLASGSLGPARLP